MANQLLNGSICLTDIPKDKIVTSEKNGKKYLNITIWINDEPDQFNNNGSISINQTKEQREAKEKKVYIGNLKYATQQQKQEAAPVSAQPKIYDSLPF